MIKIDRKENPSFVHYNDDTVTTALKKDFFTKCYICEEFTRKHYEVDHFYPQNSYPHLINDYDNLYYSCEKCNSLRPKKQNTTSENEILDCCCVDPEQYISLRLNTKECKVDIDKIKSDRKLDYLIDNTIIFLHRIYNGEGSTSNSCEDLKEDIKDEIEGFRKKLDKYEKTKLKRASLKEIKKDLDISSSYSTFKRWIVRDNDNLNIKF